MIRNFVFKLPLIVALLFLSTLVFSQGGIDMRVGKVTLSDLKITSYAKDTTAAAVVLDESGKAYISTEVDEGLIFQHYLKIKILKKKGVEQANFEIPLYKYEKLREEFMTVTASSFNLVNGAMVESKMDPKKFFRENSTNVDKVKFTLPNVQEGSVIEVKYITNSPFVFNFRRWEFQSDIPKVHSEYTTLIPGNYIYSISLKGFYPLQKNESQIVKNCIAIGTAEAECALTTYGMYNIPAFVEEEYMTAKKNYISSINFELSEVRHFDGRINKFTKEWKDVDQELKQHEDFGAQIRKARNLFSERFEELLTKEPDSLKRARVVYDFIRQWYQWDEHYGKYTDVGVKTAFETKKGNAADINLSLVGALQAAGINAYPIILSTRDNGFATQLHPVLSDFNYVIGTAFIGGNRYLLDATQNFSPFGLLPKRCLNGKGRVMDKVSYWIDLTPRERLKRIIQADVTLNEEGWQGKIDFTHTEYEARDKRIEIASTPDLNNYRAKLQNEWKGFEILDYQIRNKDSLDFPLLETMKVKVANTSEGAGTLFFDPFVVERFEANPFKATTRLYPVDFGVPLERVFILRVHYPSNYSIDELPTSMAISLPGGGGRFLMNVSSIGGTLSITSTMTINRAIFSSDEYPHLKEFFARVIQAQQSQIVLKRQ